jgi:hypothetical protein
MTCLGSDFGSMLLLTLEADRDMWHVHLTDHSRTISAHALPSSILSLFKTSFKTLWHHVTSCDVNGRGGADSIEDQLVQRMQVASASAWSWYTVFRDISIYLDIRLIWGCKIRTAPRWWCSPRLISQNWSNVSNHTKCQSKACPKRIKEYQRQKFHSIELYWSWCRLLRVPGSVWFRPFCLHSLFEHEGPPTS